MTLNGKEAYNASIIKAIDEALAREEFKDQPRLNVKNPLAEIIVQQPKHHESKMRKLAMAFSPTQKMVPLKTRVFTPVDAAVLEYEKLCAQFT
jgi:hypothetical protein